MYVHTDLAGIQWRIDPRTGRGERITPLAPSSRTRRIATVRYFPVIEPTTPPTSLDTALGYLIALRPADPLTAARTLRAEFPSLHPDHVTDAIRLYFRPHSPETKE